MVTVVIIILVIVWITNVKCENGNVCRSFAILTHALTVLASLGYDDLLQLTLFVTISLQSADTSLNHVILCLPQGLEPLMLAL